MAGRGSGMKRPKCYRHTCGVISTTSCHGASSRRGNLSPPCRSCDHKLMSTGPVSLGVLFGGEVFREERVVLRDRFQCWTEEAGGRDCDGGYSACSGCARQFWSYRFKFDREMGAPRGDR